MKRNFYEAFTLVEMLIVMGILIILMAIGITAGRFAINRANDVAHQNAVDQIYQGLQAYYTDEREFPLLCDGAACNPETLMGTSGTPGVLSEYLDQGAFNGGTEATFMYIVEADQAQTVLVCVTLGGAGDAKERGSYCNGNGFGSSDIGAGTITEKNIETTSSLSVLTGITLSDWNTDTAETWTTPGTAITEAAPA